MATVKGELRFTVERREAGYGYRTLTLTAWLDGEDVRRDSGRAVYTWQSGPGDLANYYSMTIAVSGDIGEVEHGTAIARRIARKIGSAWAIEPEQVCEILRSLHGKQAAYDPRDRRYHLLDELAPAAWSVFFTDETAYTMEDGSEYTYGLGLVIAADADAARLAILTAAQGHGVSMAQVARWAAAGLPVKTDSSYGAPDVRSWADLIAA